MARHKDSYTGERLTQKLCVQLTPTQFDKLMDSSAAAGASLSDYARDRLFRKGGKAAVAAGVRRNRDAKTLLNELTRIGNNLNQLAREANTHGMVGEQRELRRAIALLKAAMTKVLDL